jgi:hypothetical protein
MPDTVTVTDVAKLRAVKKVTVGTNVTSKWVLVAPSRNLTLFWLRILLTLGQLYRTI